jgi:hypothetical protein
MTYRYQPLYEDPEYYGDEEQEYYDDEQEQDEYSPYGTSNS